MKQSTMFRFAFLLTIFISYKLIGVSPAYDCGVMNCNWGNQFCNHDQQRCEDCDGHRHSCFTHMMQENCTQFCWGHVLQKLKDRGCKDPPGVMFGHVEASDRFHKYGSQVKVTCSPNYRLLGNPYPTCGEFGQWKHLPICEAVSCPSLINVENGRFEYSVPVDVASNTLPVNTTARLVCFHDHLARGSIATKCSENGNWTATTLPACVKEKGSWPGILIAVLAIGWILTSILGFVKLQSKREDSAIYTENNTETNNDTEEMKEPLMDRNMSSFTIDMDVKEIALQSNGVSGESGKSLADPVYLSQSGQSEEEETKVLDSHKPLSIPRQLPVADSDNSRVDPVSIPEPYSCENPPNYDTTNDRVQNRENNSASAQGPTICQKCQRPEVSLKSKDSRFESRASLGTYNDGNKGVALTGSNHGNILVVNLKVNGGNNDPKGDNEEDNDTIACDARADPVQETGMTKELEESNQVGMMETAKGKADYVIG